MWDLPRDCQRQITGGLVNKCCCRNGYIMKCMRELFWTAVMYNFVIKACYMPGSLQALPDAISRMHEYGGLLKVETMLNSWYRCHKRCDNIFQYFNMLNHVSMQSLMHIIDQVMAWRRVKFR